MSRGMCYSFDDLFRAAKRREMTESEARRFRNMTQGEKNSMVKQLVNKSDGAFKYEDRVGSDGQTYTAFETKGDFEMEPTSRSGDSVD